MARYKITDFKYLYNEDEITQEEYIDYLISDAKSCNEKISKVAAKKIIAEDRFTAYERGNQELYLSDGSILSIVKNI